MIFTGPVGRTVTLQVIGLSSISKIGQMKLVQCRFSPEVTLIQLEIIFIELLGERNLK